MNSALGAESPSEARKVALAEPPIRFVPWDNLAAEQILELMSSALGPGAAPRTPDFWRWKHELSPFGRSLGLAALAGDRLVSLRVFMRWQLSVNGRTVEAARAVDTATDPGWQRQGLFHRLTQAMLGELRENGIQLVFNTPNPRSGAGYERLGWRVLGPAPLLARPGGLASWRRNSQRGEDDSSSWVPDLPAAGEVLSMPGARALLSADSSPPDRITTARSERYLDWRYACVPGIRYYGAMRGQSVLVARARRRHGLRVLTLCELAAGPAGEDLDALLQLVRDTARGAGAQLLVACGTRGTRERAALLRAGFLPAPSRIRVMVNPLHPTEGSTDPGCWRLSLGDLELF